MKTKVQLGVILSMVLVFAASSLWAQDAFQADTLFAHKTTMEMVLDGELSEAIWQQAPVMVYWDTTGQSENVVYCQAVWDDNYLYVAHKIVDDDIVYSEDDNVEWTHDGVEIFLNPQNFIFEGENRSSFEEAGHCQFIVTAALGVYQSPEIWSPDPAPGEFAEMTADDSSYTIEAFIPLEDVEIGSGEMAIGYVWGFMSGNNDEESDGTKTQFANTKIKVAFHTTEDWGYIKILGEPETGVDDKIDGSQNPAVFQLTQNYPNPFNPSTTISYNLAKSGHVKITISDVLGKEMATLVDGYNDAGAYAVHWSGADMPSGIYLCRMQAEDAVTGQRYSEVRKLLLQK